VIAQIKKNTADIAKVKDSFAGTVQTG